MNSVLSSTYLVEVNNGSTRKLCEVCSKLTIKTQNDVIDVILVVFLKNENRFKICFVHSVVKFEQVNADFILNKC